MATDTLILTTARRVLLLTLAATLATIALGLWVIGITRDPIYSAWSWVAVILLTIGAALIASQLRRPPRLILDPTGFTLTGVAGFSVPWRGVECFLVYSDPGDDYGEGKVRPHAAWRLREGAPAEEGYIAVLHRAASFPIDGALPRTLGMKPEPLAALMEDWRRRYGS